MPDTENIIRVKNPNLNESDLRKLSNGKFNFVGTIRLGNGISALLALKKGSGTAIYDYLFDRKTWDAAKAVDWINTHKDTVRSTISDKPKIDNGMWIPFMRDGMLTQDSLGNIHKIPKEAIDNSYRSYVNGYFDVNHDDKVSGKILDTKREGEFAYALVDGLDTETLSVVNSPAYRGVSQESKLKRFSDDGKIQEIEGKGIAFVLYPKTAGCPLSSGCGLPLLSSISEPDQANFSLYPVTDEINLNSEILEGDDEELAEYTAADMKKMLQYMKDHPDMMDSDMKTMMKSMMGMMKSTIRGTMAEPETTSAETLTKPNPELETLRSNVDALKSEIAVLKTTVAQKDEQINKFNETLTSTIKNALEAHDKQRQAEIDYAAAVGELKSTITVKESVDQILAAKPDIVVLKSMITAWKATHSAPQAGAGAGTDIKSTVKTDFAALDAEFNKIIGRNPGGK